MNLLARLPLGPEDELVFLGDYIDRGPDSRGVLDALIELRRSLPRTVFLRGNHEQMMLDARANVGARTADEWESYALWMGNGGAETMDCYPGSGRWPARIPDEHSRFVEDTTMEYCVGEFAFVHAGYLPPEAQWPWEGDPRLWVREEFMHSRHDFGSIVVFGHTPQRSGKPLVLADKIGIDTGAAFGGPLSAIRLEVGQGTRFELFQA